MACNLEHKMSFIRTDVTAVKLYEEYVIAGIGSSLYVHDKNTGKRISILCHILRGQKIYGIVPTKDGSKLLIFGGKQFKIITRSILKTGDFTPGSIHCDDWLHSGIWCSDNQIALLTAHNVVQIWDVSSEPIITSQRISEDNSILYSGLLLPLLDDVLVFSGTVFSEVIISRCKNETTLRRLVGHKGVIFSISCNLQRGIIVTTSDDRSVRIWSVNGSSGSCETSECWDRITITCTNELYGHSARVMRSCITGDYIISVGEDSGICFWDLKGELLKKITAHHNAPIWSVDGNDGHLLTGGGDCSVILHPLTLATDYSHSETIKINVGTPKKLIFTARRNIVILNEIGNLIYYDVNEKTETVYKLKHESTYAMLSISSCKQIIAVADMGGNLDIFVENCKGAADLQNIISTKLPLNRILSMDWSGNIHLVLSSADGDIYVLASGVTNIEIFCTFTLPNCKERWLTAVAMGFEDNVLVAGDRCGNVHIFVKGNTNPLKTFSKVHGRYGPTTITVKTNEIISTGRDGTVKYFSIIEQNGAYRIRLMSSKDVGFPWVEKFIDIRGDLICGFQERVFVISDLRNNSKVVEVACGGGHRSWDIVRYIDKINEKYEQIIKFIYLKNSDVNMETFQLSKIASKDIVNGSHAKEINCLKTHRTLLDKSLVFFITGGEDTTLRISRIERELHFRDEVTLKQLSSIRTLKTFVLDDDKLLIVSGGGRAQICIKTLYFIRSNDEIKVVVEDLIDFLIKGTDKERKGDKTWRDCSVDFDPETRVMDLEIVERDDGTFNIYAGCSDALIRVFHFKNEAENVVFRPVGQLKYHKTCVLKTHCLRFLNKIILITCSTRGNMCFWDVTQPTPSIENDVTPFSVTTANKSGINCIGSKLISDTTVLIASGGDDNAIHVNRLETNGGDLNTARVIHCWCSDKYHSSQITGLFISDDILVTSSIDQRVTALKIKEQGNEVEFLNQITTDVADVQGIETIENTNDFITVCVFGKGLEVLTIPTAS